MTEAGDAPSDGQKTAAAIEGWLDPEAFEDPAEDLFYRAWISLLNSISHAIDGYRSYGREEAQEAMLRAALSAEGRINAFLMNAPTIDAKDAASIGRLSVPERYAIAPRLALGKNLFPRDREPWATLERVRRIRNGLVHPKPFGVEPDPDADQYDYDPLYAEFNPGTATPIVMGVARAACLLADASPELGASVEVERAVLAVETRVIELAGKHSGPAPQLDYFARQEFISGDDNVILELAEIVDRQAGRGEHA